MNIEDKIKENSEDYAIETKLDNLILDLKILANVKEFDKLSVKDSLVIDTPHTLQFVSRKWNGDSRDKTINYIENCVSEIFAILNFLLDEEIEKAEPICLLQESKEFYLNNSKYNKKQKFKEDTINIYQKISQSLNQSITGLQNLKITYLNDITTTSKLDMLIVKIQNRINKMNNMMVFKPN